MANLSNTVEAARTTTFSRSFYNTAWRWHFYAGLYVVPFLLMLAVTGLIMLWSSVLQGRDGEYRYSVSPAGQEIAVSRQADAAVASVPDSTIAQYIAPRDATTPAVFRVKTDDNSTMVAVDPYSGKVLGQWERRTALYDLAEKIHGTLLIGTIGDRLIEIAAGFGVVLVVTGAYLWWPRNGTKLGAALKPQMALKGRALWKSLHQTVGIYAGLFLVIFFVSGLSWAGVWGEKLTQAWSTFPAAKWDNVPLSDVTHASMNTDGIKEVPWTLEETPMPASGSNAGVPGLSAGQPVDVDRIVAFARAIGFDGRFQLSYPEGDTGVWTLARDTMSYDSSNPMSDRTVHIDRYTGNVLADVKYSDYGVAGKAMAVGVAFHEGTIGTWNLVFVTVYCLAVIFLSVSGIVMWWKRRPAGAGRLVAPQNNEPHPLWKGGAIVMLVCALLFPLSGGVLIAVLLLDLLVIRNIKPLKRALS